MGAPSDRSYIVTFWAAVMAIAVIFAILTLCVESITLTQGVAAKVMDTGTASGWLGSSTSNFRTVYLTQTYTVFAIIVAAASFLRIKSLI